MNIKTKIVIPHSEQIGKVREGSGRKSPGRPKSEYGITRHHSNPGAECLGDLANASHPNKCCQDIKKQSSIARRATYSSTDSPKINMSETADKAGSTSSTNKTGVLTPCSNDSIASRRHSATSTGVTSGLGMSKDKSPPSSTGKGEKFLTVTSCADDKLDFKRLSASDMFLKPMNYSNLSTSVGVLAERNPSPVSKPEQDSELLISRRKKHLHRSHSDLSSCRHSRTSSDFSDLSSRLSRTSTEIERFFNEMGLDRTVLDPVFKFHDSKAKDIDFLDSLSSLGSREANSLCSGLSKNEIDIAPGESETDLMERSLTQTSVVERNARIIKWLYNVKKARSSNQPLKTT
ncbi:hypothetical protein ACJMK2_040537 [Sinanodonta woodiana]|uniref:Centrosome-associated FAM110 C-terminal domain-containing protein n=1 Tax=Sinanodonta woodiana TaxID=1069815 RepID=A0ABD3W1A7_SINWO